MTELGEPVLRIELPYLPPAECSLNFRGHWAERYKAARKVMTDVVVLVLEQGWERPPLKQAHLQVRWGVPDRRIRDMDNLFSATKPAIDALVYHPDRPSVPVLVNDDLWHVHYELDGFLSRRHPKTIITVSEVERRVRRG